MKTLKIWYARSFKVITNDQAKNWGLTYVRNVHGDEINNINCRSIWKDTKGKTYRVKNLV